MPTFSDRTRTIRDGLDAGVPVDDIRVDIDALQADLELTGFGQVDPDRVLDPETA